MSELANIITERYGVNKPVLTEDILGLFPTISRQAIYKKLNAAIASGELLRFGRGVYFIPMNTRFGTSIPSAQSLVERKWLKEEDGTCGYLSGASLANELGVSEQVPAVLDVVTNRETTQVRDVAPFGGWKRIRLRRPRTKITEENVDALRFLDLITDEPVASMDEGALAALRTFARKLDRARVYECASFYPAKTSKRLVECEAKDVFA